MNLSSLFNQKEPGFQIPEKEEMDESYKLSPLYPIKQDIVKFKNESKYKNSKWFSSRGNGIETFTRDYMNSRNLKDDVIDYTQLAYICMCRNWDMSRRKYEER